MKILIAPDSFKDALPAARACGAIRQGILRAMPTAEVQCFPLADGGEGTAEVLAWHLPGELIDLTVSDPLFRSIRAQYFLFENRLGQKTAFIEMAQASGLQLLQAGERNPLKTSTFGTGELLLDALHRGCEEVVLAIGGSATNDAGMGMAVAFGWRFLDEDGSGLPPIGENLGRVKMVLPPEKATHQLPFSTKKIAFKVLCDVTNPLFGPQGAAYVFAPQKGADAVAVRLLDEGLRHFSAVVSGMLGADFSQKKGAGAAGGLGFGAMAFLGAELQPGAAGTMDLVGFNAALAAADLVVTGEGRLDGQTRHGKLVAVVCEKAGVLGVPVVAICGAVDATSDELREMGLKMAVSLMKPHETVADSIARTEKSLAEAAYNVLKIMQLQE